MQDYVVPLNTNVNADKYFTYNKMYKNNYLQINNIKHGKKKTIIIICMQHLVHFWQELDINKCLNF